MGIFDYLEMLDNYDSRKIAYYKGPNSLVVDTCLVTDSKEPFETAVSHPDYNRGNFIAVECYPTKEEAKMGHEKWMSIMCSDILPDSLTDVGTSEIANLERALKIILTYQRQPKNH